MSDVIGNIASANLDGVVTPKASVNGSLYPKGEKGDPGNGISSIVKTGSVGKVDTYTITFDDGTTTTFNVTNGEDGINGVDGANGKSLEFNWQGTQLGIRVEGESQYTYVDLKGTDGYTPVKGTDYFTPAEIADIESDIISQIDTLKKQIVQTLPVSDIDPNTIYLVPKQSATQGDVYDEWLYINNAWEHIGSTQVDLTDYYNKTQTDTLLAAKQDNLVSGTNIKTINNQSVLGNGNINIEGNEVYISDDDTNIPASAKLFIDESEGTDAYSEVVNSLAGDEIAKAPSVHAVNEALGSIIESGSNGNGNYIKYSDGTMICTKRVSITTTINIAYGSLYRSYATGIGNFPQAFIQVPTVQILISNFPAICMLGDDHTTTELAKIFFVAPEQVESRVYYVNVIAIGRWK